MRFSAASTQWKGAWPPRSIASTLSAPQTTAPGVVPRKAPQRCVLVWSAGG
ncbi:MAG: hypothetical protein U0871_22740 [Gemmataceae bacterium]